MFCFIGFDFICKMKGFYYNLLIIVVSKKGWSHQFCKDFIDFQNSCIKYLFCFDICFTSPSKLHLTE